MNTAVKAALLGVDHPHARALLHTLQLLPEVESIVLWDSSAEALARVRETQGEKVQASLTDLDELLRSKDISFGIVCGRTDLNPELCLRMLAAGKHVLSEKPIGKTAAEVEPIVRAAERAGLQLGVCYQNRYYPATLEARRIIGEGALGELMTVEIRMLTTQIGIRNPKHWLYRREYSGGGIVSWLGCHYLDLMRFITRDEIVSVAAEIATRGHADIDVEDVAVLSLRFRSGAIGSLHLAFSLAFRSGALGTRQAYDTYLGFNGRKGRVHWTDMLPHLDAESVDPRWSVSPARSFDYALPDSPAYAGAYGEAFVLDFVRATQGVGTCPASGRDALYVARIVDAAYESSRTGRRVEVSLD